MNKKFEEDNELKKLLDEQLIREAEIMEEALFSDEDFEDYEMTDEEVEASYKKLMESVNDAAEKKTEPVEEEKIIPIQEKHAHTGRRLPAMRVAGIAVACIAGVFAASMTSEGNRQYVVESMRYLLGEDTRIVVSNDEQNDKSSSDEYEAIADIEETLGVDVPEFMYRPSGFEYQDYYVNKKAGNAWIEYGYKEAVITLDIDQKGENSSSKIDSMHGSEKNTVNIIREDIVVDIRKIQDEKDIIPSYSAQWERKGTIYLLSGKLERDIFCKIIEEIRY
ncbi:MAG TPA: DUF4367 domain-containing protein [Candidatus Blautia faecavium]|uniref:DUF4367 domain-containing protein n=1 Tax=Candidatus Blautia faecavium TaxID=2838487 RepID=A0A9D2LRT1_9FIRM|nr:DUF4367 domain-containing protein [Candidatus Blautia faecavium]